MKISFCVPCYNKELYLADAIESILHQTYKDTEIIIVNDNSNDGTKHVGQYYADTHKNIKFISNKKNVGVASCRNIAWSHAAGDIICVQDADDISLPDRAKITAKYFKTHPDLHLMYGSCLVSDTFNRNYGSQQAEQFSVVKLKKDNYISHPTVAYKRNIPVRYREGIRYIDDWYFYLDCIMKGLKIEGIIQQLSIYRVTSDGLTLKNGFTNNQKIKAREVLRKEFSDLEEDLSQKLKDDFTQQIRIKEIIKQIPRGSNVLDMGCNGGYIMQRIKKKGCKVEGIDRSRYLVNICHKKGLSVRHGDIAKVMVLEKWDRILFGDILEHYNPVSVNKLLKTALEGLKRNGKIIITVPYKHGCYSMKFIKDHVKDYELADFKEMFPNNKIKAKAIICGNNVIPLWFLIAINK